MQIFPDLLRCIVAVHEGHVAIHEDKFVTARSVVVRLDISLHHTQRLLAVECDIAVLLRVYAHSAVENYQSCVNIEALVVNYQDLFVCYLDFVILVGNSSIERQF